VERCFHVLKSCFFDRSFHQGLIQSVFQDFLFLHCLLKLLLKFWVVAFSLLHFRMQILNDLIRARLLVIEHRVDLCSFLPHVRHLNLRLFKLLFELSY
jgi:hypothetical protein